MRRAVFALLLTACTPARAATGCQNGNVTDMIARVCDLQNNIVCYYVSSDSSVLINKGFNHVALSCVHL